jgi:hypothetical protein
LSPSINVGAVGFKGLLNLSTKNHRTIIFSDADLPVSIREKIVADLAECNTQVNFLRTFDIAPDVRAESIKRIGLERDREYVSIILMTNDPKSHHYVIDFISALEYWDFARIEYPMIGGNLPNDRIAYLFSVINHADYGEQDKLSELFYEYLGQSDNYTVSINTDCGTLTVQDSKPWFQLAGQLQQFEKRILPGGEVA